MTDRPRLILHNSQTQELAARLRETYPQVICKECNSYSELPELVSAFAPDAVYTVRFAGSEGFPAKALLGEGGPRWVANGGAGTDHLGHWDTGKTTVTNAAGVASDMMAEYIFGGFLHFTLDVPGLNDDKSKRLWRERTVVPLYGKTLLIVGLGHTGRAVAKRAKAFGMRVLGTRARPTPTDNVDETHGADELTKLLPRADFVAVSTPLVASTRGLIGPEQVAAMKPGAIIADVSRGGVIDHQALRGALLSGHVAGAALDVFEAEPLPPESPMWDLKNLIISPHCSSVHADWEAASFDLFLQNLGRWIRNEPLINVVDPDRGY